MNKMNKQKKKEFDAVKMMREFRDRLSKRYLADPSLQEKELRQIHKKYNLKPHKDSVVNF